MLVAALLTGGLLAACGDDTPGESGQAVTTTTAATSTTVAGRSHTAELTTTDGYRYDITVDVGAPSPTGAPDDCPATPAPGRVHLPVTLTVANASADRPAPFPPVRVEMASAPGTRPGHVMLRDTSGTCTFAPRVPSIGAGSSVVFEGTSPAIDAGAAPGSAGRIEVKVSETQFTLAAPVP